VGPVGTRGSGWEEDQNHPRTGELKWVTASISCGRAGGEVQQELDHMEGNSGKNTWAGEDCWCFVGVLGEVPKKLRKGKDFNLRTRRVFRLGETGRKSA